MPDRHVTRDTHEAPTSIDSAVMIGIVLAAAIALLVLFGANMSAEIRSALVEVFPHVTLFLENNVEGVTFQPHAPGKTA